MLQFLQVLYWPVCKDSWSLFQFQHRFMIYTYMSNTFSGNSSFPFVFVCVNKCIACTCVCVQEHKCTSCAVVSEVRMTQGQGHKAVNLDGNRKLSVSTIQSNLSCCKLHVLQNLNFVNFHEDSILPHCSSMNAFYYTKNPIPSCKYIFFQWRRAISWTVCHVLKLMSKEGTSPSERIKNLLAISLPAKEQRTTTL